MILDSSAVLADLRGEPGGPVARAALPHAAISAVNWAELVAKVEAGTQAELHALGELEVPVIPFDDVLARRAGALLARHRGVLSLGDCACIATAEARGLAVLTADRIWATLGLPVEIRLIR